MRPIRTVRAASAASFESLGTLLSSHQALARVALAALSFVILVAISQQAAPTTQAGPEPAPVIPESLLPENVGIAIASDDSITIPFEAPMDPASVAEAFQLVPSQRFELSWNAERTALTVSPEHLWRTDERFLVVIGGAARQADGQPVAATVRYSFTTQTAPTVSDFQVRLAPSAAATAGAADGAATALTTDAPSGGRESQPPTETARDVSTRSGIIISFSSPMDEADVTDHFSIAPEVEGELSWRDGDLVFRPAKPLEPGSRYTISLGGAHDLVGNRLGGKGSFSFIVQDGAQITKTAPGDDTVDVEPGTVEMWFSQPMDVEATNAAFALTDRSTGALVGGLLNWNGAGTQLIYTPDVPFAGGRTFEVTLDDGAKDVDGNTVTTAWQFTTKAAPVVAAPRATTTTRTAPVVPPAAPATSLAGYALNQVNAARAAYGFAPVVLDGAISAVASRHAMDQAVNNYFSHYSLDGSSREDRLRAGGVSFGWSGENQCYHIGMSQQATLDWCHSAFMAEPYPGQWNHIANILNPNARRMGVGIATVGSKTVITWDFTD
ncbi:MAG TPA: Ig-like domain-containing protein [Candidatus Limnocylindria bacterium]